MQTKLTLRMDRTLIERAKAHAARRGASLSQMVADFFAVLDAGEDREEHGPEDLPPIVRSLYGVLGEADVDIEDYRRYLEDKHR